MAQSPIYTCPNCASQLRLKQTDPIDGSILECSNCTFERFYPDDIVHVLRAENVRLNAIVSALADLHEDGNPQRVIELCNQYKVDVPYWLGGGVVEVEALRRVAHEFVHYHIEATTEDAS